MAGTRPNLPRFIWFTGLMLVGLAAVALTNPLAGRASGGCDLYASPAGSDSGSGSSSAPLQSPQALADALAPGQVGCFEEGTFDSYDHGIKVSTAGITLTSAPGARATVIGRWWIAEGADNVTISHLNLNGRNAIEEAGPVVNAASTTFDDVDVTNDHTVICFILGSFEYGAAINTVIENSRIHDCGELPAINHDHGIYMENSEGAVIRNNWIYDNADRGIQFYPNADDSLVYGNVIDGNGQGVIFSSAGDEVSSNNIVENNIISNSTIRWNAEAYWGEGGVGSGNVVRNNCLWASNRDDYYNQGGGIQPASQGGTGFTARENVIADPQFVDAAGHDFTLAPGSPCAFAQAHEAQSRVILRKHQSVVMSDAPVVLTGHAATTAGEAVTILRWKDGIWRPFAKRRLRTDGSFVVRKRLRGVHGATRLRAVVAGAGLSRAVRVRVRPTR